MWDRLPRTILIPGYVLDSDVLERVDSVSREAFDRQDGAEDGVKSSLLITTFDNKDFKFDSLASLLNRLDAEASKVQSISLKYFALRSSSAINVVFEQKGSIRLSAFGDEGDFQFNVDRLESVLHEADPEYGWPIRILLFRDWSKKLLGWSLAVVSLILLGLLAYYAYGKKVGVNVDPSIIPGGYTYFQDVDRAIKSNDTNAKLNVLLQGQVYLSGFENIRDILERTKRQIAFASFILIILAVLNLVRWRLVRLYPISFFSFGHNKRVLQRLQRKRDIWLTAIVIAFIVNVVAGFVVALSVR